MYERAPPEHIDGSQNIRSRMFTYMASNGTGAAAGGGVVVPCMPMMLVADCWHGMESRRCAAAMGKERGGGLWGGVVGVATCVRDEITASHMFLPSELAKCHGTMGARIGADTCWGVCPG